MLGFPLFHITVGFVAVSMAEFYPNPCSDGEFWCTNGFCIDGSLVCDTNNDCGDMSDERSCHNCSMGEFACGPGEGECINPSEVCDDECDCPYCFEEDATYCFNKTSPSPCHMGQFWCSNNECCDSQKVCDGNNDCGDSSDERSCAGCPEGSFSCSKDPENSVCIDPALVCDNVCHCADCEDEDNNCYHKGSGLPINPIALAFIILAALAVVYMICMGIRYYIKKRMRLKRSGPIPRIEITPEVDPPDMTEDLPPSYTTVANNPVFVIDTNSLNGDSDEDDLLHAPVRFSIGSPGGSRNSSFRSNHSNFSITGNNLLNPSSLQADAISNRSYKDGKQLLPPASRNKLAYYEDYFKEVHDEETKGHSSSANRHAFSGNRNFRGNNQNPFRGNQNAPQGNRNIRRGNHNAPQGSNKKVLLTADDFHGLKL